LKVNPREGKDTLFAELFLIIMSDKSLQSSF